MSFIWQHGQETTGIARVPEYGGGIKDSTDRQSQFQVGGLGDLRELPRRVWAPESQPPTFWVILKLDHELCCILYRLSVTYYWVAKSCNTRKCNILSTITLSDSPPKFLVCFVQIPRLAPVQTRAWPRCCCHGYADAGNWSGSTVPQSGRHYGKSVTWQNISRVNSKQEKTEFTYKVLDSGYCTVYIYCFESAALIVIVCTYLPIFSGIWI